MTNTNLLLEKIKESGLKIGYIAESLGISYHWFRKKVHNEVAFKAYEIQILCELLNITDPHEKERIFFAQNVE